MIYYLLTQTIAGDWIMIRPTTSEIVEKFINPYK